MATRQLQRIGLAQALVTRLHACNITTARDLFSRTLLDLVELLDLPYETVSQILREVALKITPPPLTALDLWRQAAGRALHLRSMLQPLDAALHGGIPAGSITEVVGPAGLGKTQFCLTMAVVGCLDHWEQKGSVLYIDTERKFSSQRLAEIARARFPAECAAPGAVEALLERILILTPDNSAELSQRLAALEPLIIDHGVKLVIVDSVAALARSDYGAGAASLAERQAALSAQAARLKYLAETFGLPVLVTNQVTTLLGRDGQGEGQLTAALGTLWAHAVNTRLVLESHRGTRFLRIAKSPAAPATAFAYHVTTGGLEVRPGVEVPPELLAGGSVVEGPIANEVPYEQAGAFMAE